jgi:hypothetical protein
LAIIAMLLVIGSALLFVFVRRSQQIAAGQRASGDPVQA